MMCVLKVFCHLSPSLRSSECRLIVIDSWWGKSTGRCAGQYVRVALRCSQDQLEAGLRLGFEVGFTENAVQLV